MPILNDIMDHKVIGPAIREGLTQGLAQGIEQGLEQGRREGSEQGRREEAAAFLRRLMVKRFGPIPTPIEDRLKQLSAGELEDIGERLVDAKTVAELFEQG